jgi:sugar phosphate isomerase/epimerase
VDDNWPQFKKVWKPLVKFAEDRGVRIAIENCPMFFTKDEWPGGKNLAYCPAVWRRMFEEIPSDNFGLNYDPSHLIWQQIDYLQPMREFRDRIFHAHAKDARVDKNRLNEVGILATPLEYHSPKLPGLGDVDWGQFFSVLGDTGYKGPVCIEVEDRAYEATLETRKEALRQSARFLRQFIPQKV